MASVIYLLQHAESMFIESPLSGSCLDKLHDHILRHELIPHAPAERCDLQRSYLLHHKRLLIEHVTYLKIYNRTVHALIEKLLYIFIYNPFVLCIIHIDKEKNPEIKQTVFFAGLELLSDHPCSLIYKKFLSAQKRFEITEIALLNILHTCEICIRIYSEKLLLHKICMSLKYLHMQQSKPVHAIFRPVFYQCVKCRSGLRYIFVQIYLVCSEINICPYKCLLGPLHSKPVLPALRRQLDYLRFPDADPDPHILICIPYIYISC